MAQSPDGQQDPRSDQGIEGYTTVKKHGLWQFHRALHKSYFSNLAWWLPENMERCANAVRYVLDTVAWDQNHFTKSAAIKRCAFRTMRRYGLPKRAGVWNGLVEKISNRMYAHRNAVRACLVQEHEARAHQLIDIDEFYGATARHNLKEIHQRAKDMRLTVNRSLMHRGYFTQGKCDRCKKTEVKTKFFFNLRKKGIDIRPVQGLTLCVKCGTYFEGLIKTSEEAEQTLNFVNQVKEKLRESTKVNPRNARGSGLHHGGGH